MHQPSALELDLSTLPKVVCALDLETSGPNAIKPDLANLAVVGLKIYTWDEQQKSYLPGPYEHYAPTNFSALQQRLDELPGPIIGHNLFNFDYLILRRHLNLEQIVEKSADTLHFLYEQDGGGEKGYLYGLDLLAKENFGERKTAKGSTVPKLLKEGKLAEVLAYNEHDCDLTFRVWWKMVSERHISAGEASDDEGELFEVTYELEEKDINILTCATPRFTYLAWIEQLERDGWIVMPPKERRRREKEHERRRMEAREAASKRDSAMREFIRQHLRDDIPRKYVPVFDWHDHAAAPLDFEKTRVLLGQTDLPRSIWVEEMICRLLQGERIRPAKLELAGLPDDPESRAELIKNIMISLIADGYTVHYTANEDADNDVIFLASPPPRPRTLAEQHVDRMRERYFEQEALFGPSGVGFELPRWASNVDFVRMKAMNSLQGDGHLVFEDGSYVLDIDEIDLFKLQPKVLTSEEIATLDAYIQDHLSEADSRP